MLMLAFRLSSNWPSPKPNLDPGGGFIYVPNRVRIWGKLTVGFLSAALRRFWASTCGG